MEKRDEIHPIYGRIAEHVAKSSKPGDGQEKSTEKPKRDESRDIGYNPHLDKTLPWAKTGQRPGGTWVGFYRYVPHEQLETAEAAAEMFEAAALTNLQACGELQRKLADALTEINRVRSLINRDRTGLAAGLDAVRKLVDGFSWLANDFDWGSYHYGDHSIATLRREIGSCFTQVGEVIDKALKASGDRATSAFHPENDPLPKLEAKLAEVERERSGAVSIMAKLSSHLGCEPGDESTSMAQYLDRIWGGISAQERVAESMLGSKDATIKELETRLSTVSPAAVQELAKLARDNARDHCETCQWWRAPNMEQAQDAECFNRDGLVNPPRNGKGFCPFHLPVVP